MRITVLWEDQRGGIVKGFGPHELLVSCVADELLERWIVDEFQRVRTEVNKYVLPVPKKGNGNVMHALQQDYSRLSRIGPVCAVLDRDKAVDLLRQAGQRPAACLSGIRTAVYEKAPGGYELILLIENVETLVMACCAAANDDVPQSKPSPDERDRIMGKFAWRDAHARTTVRDAVPSFDRLVRWVAGQLSSDMDAR